MTRRRLKKDVVRADLDGEVGVFYYNAYDHIGSISGQGKQVFLTDAALDDLYEALKQREALRTVLTAKYGEDA